MLTPTPKEIVAHANHGTVKNRAVAFTAASQLFDVAFRACNEVYKEHPWLLENEDEMVDVIEQYQRRILNGKPLPDDFPLRDFPNLLPRKP